MKKLLFVLLIVSLLVAFRPGPTKPPPPVETNPPPIETNPPPVETNPPPVETSPPPIETEKPKSTEPVETIEPGVTPEVKSSPNPKGSNDKEAKVISLPKSGYGPVENQNKDILGYILIVAVLGLTVIILGGMIRKKPND